MRHRSPWVPTLGVWLLALLLSCGNGNEAACDEADSLSAQIADQASSDGISGQGICSNLSQQGMESTLIAQGFRGNVMVRAAEYVSACTKLRQAAEECEN